MSLKRFIIPADSVDVVRSRNLSPLASSTSMVRYVYFRFGIRGKV
ncbi:MAG: hypothetical protein RBR63_10600 [Methanosarcina vacuolata]|nr:hypothetical protein [Methanosarcina vacuolata]